MVKLFLALLLTLLAVPAYATTYWVSTSGNDSNSCGTASGETPLTTNAKRNFTGASGAISCLSSGDILYARTGSYTEALGSGIPSGGGSFATATRIEAYNGEAVTIRGAGFANNENYIILRGFTMDRAGTADEGVYISTGHHIRVQNCTITGANRQGVFSTDAGAGGNEFIDLDVHTNGTTVNLDHGFYIETDNNLFRRVKSHGNAAHGMQIYNSVAGSPDNNTVEDSEFYSNGTLGGAYNLVVYGTGNVIRNTVIRDMTGANAGLYTEQGGTKKFLNLTIYNNGGTGIEVAASANISTTHIKNTIIRSQSADYSGGGSTTRTTNLCQNAGTGCSSTSDPLFVNAGSGDLRLQSGSPAKDIATDLSGEGYSTDKNGVTRPQGSAWDIGAFEFVVGTPRAPSNARVQASTRTGATSRTAASGRVQVQ